MYTHKYLIHLSFLGTDYSGWQIQDNAKSIQGQIMEALNKLLDKKIPLIVGAGRTDAGVHAINFFAHFECNKIDVIDLKYKLNRFLPKDICIHKIINVPHDFHARYSAISRQYEYWISIVKDPFLIDRVYFFNQELDIELMNKASKKLIGTQDFSAFSKSRKKNNLCNVKSAIWYKSKNILIFSIEADRFLYNMVRCIVGTLIDVGIHKINIDDFLAIRNSHNRDQAGYSAPASGLYLTNVKYSNKIHFESI